MVYNSTYAPADFKFILTDILGEFGVQTIAYIGLILAVIVIIFLFSRFKRH